MRFAFAGDRDLAVDCLEFLLKRGDRPEVLLLAGPKRASHADALAALCEPFLPPERILRGTWFRGPKGQAFLRELDLDLCLSVHFPYIVPPEVLALPRRGFLNLHPAYLPYNRGWHTPTWALLEGTPIGATLHLMDAGVDTGDILAQKVLEPTLGDTANSLYRKLKALEVALFTEAWPAVVEDRLTPVVQDPEAGTSHVKDDLFDPAVQRIDLDAPTTARELLRRLRGLTTNRLDEAAWFEADGSRYRVQVAVTEEPPEE